ncbi:hypothetical protein AB1L42_20450 [Thalassoglobus sp. JC818]|uniref:hypothetical protein n=1 Tax=Thalassoglobus sp. JC818 TaxID=3232136 RepID=UPI0034596B69
MNNDKTQVAIEERNTMWWYTIVVLLTSVFIQVDLWSVESSLLPSMPVSFATIIAIPINLVFAFRVIRAGPAYLKATCGFAVLLGGLYGMLAVLVFLYSHIR